MLPGDSQSGCQRTLATVPEKTYGAPESDESWYMGTGKKLLQKYKQEIVRMLKIGGNKDMMGHWWICVVFRGQPNVTILGV